MMFLHYILRLLAITIIKKYHPDIIGITGSVGKTSTKEAVATVLSSRFSVRRSAKNYNNELGLPLTVIGFDKSPGSSFFGWLQVIFSGIKLLITHSKNYPDILVLEMGADKPGDISYLTSIAPCTVGVLTAISHAHTEFFKTIKKIAQEKRIIISHLDPSGFAVLNYDSDLVMEQTAKTKAEIITYGTKEGADVRGTDIKIIYDDNNVRGLNFKISFRGQNVVPVFLPGAVAEHLVLPALAGLAVGHAFGINLVEGAESLRELKPIPGHMHIVPGIKNTTLIDDTYNSSPEAAKAAIQTLASIPLAPGKERYAVLGDMLELGNETVNAHREVGWKVAELGISMLITVGEASKHTAAAAHEAGMVEHTVISFPDSIVAGRFLQDTIKPGDLLLIKGSQGARMERIVKELMADPLSAESLLVRQGAEWQK